MDETRPTLEELVAKIATARVATVRAHEDYVRSVAEYNELEGRWRSEYGLEHRLHTTDPPVRNGEEMPTTRMSDRIRAVLESSQDIDFDADLIAEHTGDAVGSVRTLLAKLVATGATWLVRTSKGRYQSRSSALSDAPPIEAHVSPMSENELMEMPRINDRIHHVFRQHPERHFTASQIAAIIHGKAPLIATYLSTMASAWKIERVSRGVYKAVSKSGGAS